MMKTALVALMAYALPTAAHAQLSGLLKNAASAVTGSNTTGSVVSSLVGNLLGTNKVSEKNLVGTWTYTEPCVVMESDDVLSNLGGAIATNKLVKNQKKLLEKAGFKAGKVVMTLNSDKSGTVTVNGKTVNCTWGVSGSDLTLTVLTRSVKMNTRLNGSELQLAMNADKLLTLVTAVSGKASGLNSNFATLNTLLGKYNGLFLGLKFSKS